MKRVKKICTIAFRDLKSYFYTPLGYFLISVFMFIVGFMFFRRLGMFLEQSLISSRFGRPLEVSLNDAIVKPLFGTIHLLLLFIIPLITMRLISEEKKLKTMELLFTSPLNNMDIILGKFSAGAMKLIIIFLLSSIYLFVLIAGGNPDIGQIWMMSLGIVLLAFSYLAIGIFWSSVTENQIIAATFTFLFILFLWIIEIGAKGSTFIAKLFKSLSITAHFDSFVNGVFSLQDIVFFLSIIVFFLYLASVSLDSRNWE